MEIFLTVKEVAKNLRCAPETVYNLLKTGAIPYIKVGRSLRVKQSALEEWIKTQEEHRT